MHGSKETEFPDDDLKPTNVLRDYARSEYAPPDVFHIYIYTNYVNTYVIARS